MSEQGSGFTADELELIAADDGADRIAEVAERDKERRDLLGDSVSSEQIILPHPQVSEERASAYCVLTLLGFDESTFRTRPPTEKMLADASDAGAVWVRV